MRASRNHVNLGSTPLPSARHHYQGDKFYQFNRNSEKKFNYLQAKNLEINFCLRIEYRKLEKFSPTILREKGRTKIFSQPLNV